MRLLALVAFYSVFIFSNHSLALCVTAEKANLRNKPSGSGKLVWTVGKFMPLLEIKRQSGWYNVKDVDGKSMWISASLVSSRIDCAVVRKPSSSLRKGPGKRFPTTPLRVAYKYTPFKKVDRDGAWLKLVDDFSPTAFRFLSEVSLACLVAVSNWPRAPVILLTVAARFLSSAENSVWTRFISLGIIDL